MIHIRPFIILSVILLSSCIHEFRENCPTYLTMDLSQIPADVASLDFAIEYGDGRCFTGKIPEESIRTSYEIPIPRGRATLALYGNIINMQYREKGYITPVGHPADDIYTYFTENEYLSDLTTELVNITKDNLKIYIKIIEAGEIGNGVMVGISGSVTGYDNKGEIINGEFYHSPECSHCPTPTEEYYLFETRIPRFGQKDHFFLVVCSTDGKENIAELSITQKAAEAGIDLHNLQSNDLYITIDCSSSKLYLSVKDFDSIGHTEITY